YPDALAEARTHRLDDCFLGGEVHGKKTHLAFRTLELRALLRHQQPLDEMLGVLCINLLDARDLAQIRPHTEYHPRASFMTVRISRTAWSRPMKIARETSAWPMLSSTICGRAATGPTLCAFRPWPACTMRPSFSACSAATFSRSSSFAMPSPSAFA